MAVIIFILIESFAVPLNTLARGGVILEQRFHHMVNAALICRDVYLEKWNQIMPADQCTLQHSRFAGLSSTINS